MYEGILPFLVPLRDLFWYMLCLSDWHLFWSHSNKLDIRALTIQLESAMMELSDKMYGSSCHGGRWGKGVEVWQVWHTSDDVGGCTNPISFHRRSLRYNLAGNNKKAVHL